MKQNEQSPQAQNVHENLNLLSRLSKVKQRLLKIVTMDNEQPMLSKPSKQQKKLF